MVKNKKLADDLFKNNFFLIYLEYCFVIAQKNVSEKLISNLLRLTLVLIIG